jgi:DNA-3-methyladenine glycosylase
MISWDAGPVARVVNPKEFLSHATVAHARSLLGRTLVRTSAEGCRRLLITEVEAYDGENDLACHASKGRTPRTEIMYRPGGIWYVYLCYGLHEMLNLVTGPADYPAAVLIRGVSGIDGPGRLTKQLAIGRQLNGQPARPSSGLHLEDPPGGVPAAQIRRGPRIGVSYAGPHWAGKRWRFWLDPGFARSLSGLISRPLPPAPDTR